MNLNPYIISFIIFIFVSLNVLHELNNTIQQIQINTHNVSRLMFIWNYTSIAYRYILNMFLAIFVVFALLTVCTILLVITFYCIKGVSHKGDSHSEITDNIKMTITENIKKYIMMNVWYMYTFLFNTEAIIAFCLLLPLIMFVFSLGFAITIYKPSDKYLDDDDLSKKTRIMETFHHIFYYVFVGVLISISFYLLYDKYTKEL